MNSAAQIAIGTIVLGAAFVIGIQMRSQNAKSEVQTEQSNPESSEFVWQKPPYSNQTEAQPGLIEMPEARKRVPAIPEPARLDLASRNANQADQQPESPQLPASETQHQPILAKTIVEPDFSSLASSFSETRENQASLLKDTQNNIAPLPRLLPTEPSPESGQLETSSSQSLNRIVDKYDIAPRSTAFQADDFAPQLKGANPQVESGMSINENQPPPPVEFDVDNNADRLVSSSPVQAPQFAHKIPLDAAEQVASEAETETEIPVLLPQELTQATNRGMIEVSSRQSNGLRLETNRFIRHRSKPGETLQQVSRQYYGKPDFYLDIYLANQDVLRNPGRIPSGTSLRIPVYD
jgi:hypothetical protein